MGMLAINVSLLRKRIGITVQQLATRLGVGTTTISNIETGYITSPGMDFLQKLACVFDTTVDGILGNAPLDIAERARMVYIVDSIDPQRPFVEADRIVGSVFIDRDELRGYDYFGLKIRDNSMANKRLLAGDVVIVRVDSKVKNNDIVVAVAKGYETAVVRTYHKFNDGVILKAENDSDLYSDIRGKEGENSLKVIGKVVKCEFHL